MPSYFPEGNTPRPTDSFERLLQKAASLVSARNGGADAPSPDDSRERTMYKFVRGLSASISESSNLDPDALAYAVASGAADVVAIDAFVKGVKSLGLWNNMVCWPLRSRQNAGTGTVVHSLGGLGTFNGTLVNGPAWGADGIDINAAISPTPSISIDPSPLSDFANGHSWFVVMKPTGPNPAGGTFDDQWRALQAGVVLQAGATGTGGTSGWMVNARTQTERRYSQSAILGYGSVRNNFGFVATNSSSGSTSYKYALENLTPVSPPTGTTVFYSGTNLSITAAGSTSRNTSAFVLVTTPQFNLSASLQTALETLYKSTLGTGLGLP